jgi:hypothetical protein
MALYFHMRVNVIPHLDSLKARPDIAYTRIAPRLSLVLALSKQLIHKYYNLGQVMLHASGTQCKLVSWY